MKRALLFKKILLFISLINIGSIAWATDLSLMAVSKESKASTARQRVANIKGRIEVYVRDPINFDKAYVDYVLYADDGIIYSLQFTTAPPSDLKTNVLVEIKKGFLLNDREIYLSDQDISVTKPVKTLAIDESFGPQKSIIMLVNFQNAPSNKPFTLQQVKDNFFTTLNNAYYEFSYHQTTVVGDALDWVTLPISSNTNQCSDQFLRDIANYADAAAVATGINLGQYRRRVYVMPKVPACQFAGVALIGSNEENWSRAWLNGNIALWLIGHELGHNLGLLHAHSLYCNGKVNTGTCIKLEYGDTADMMANINPAHFNAFQKDRLGWLNYKISPPIETVTNSGTYTIAPYETFDSNIKALKIPKRVLANGTTDYYYLEYRQPIGFDSVLGCSNCDFTKGVILHQANSDPFKYNDSSFLLDLTPTDDNRNYVALLPGKSFTDPDAPNGGVTFTVNSVANNGANVSVQFGSTPFCLRNNQTMTIQPTATAYVMAGWYVYYTIQIKNNDSTSCPISTFNLLSSPPANISAYLNQSSLTISPGSTASTTLIVGSSFSTPSGVYSVPVKSTSSSVPTNTSSIAASYGIY